jgi:hypothetical protein
MVIIVGDTRSREFIAKLQQLGWGRMFIERKITPYPHEPWGFDNGAYRDWIKGKGFDESRYLKAVDTAVKITEEAHYPYLSVIPDRVAKGIESLDFSAIWFDKLKRYMGKNFEKFNWYLAVQDGMTESDVEEFIKSYPEVKGLFLGGTDKFKATAPDWSMLAKKHNLRFHYARAGTPRKYALAKMAGADSIDSAFPIWVKERFQYFVENGEKYYQLRKQQLTLFGGK